MSNSGLTIKGEGELDGVPFDGEWSQPFGKPGAASSVRADIALNAKTLETFKIALPPDTIAGEGRAWFAMDLVKGQPLIFLSHRICGVCASPFHRSAGPKRDPRRARWRYRGGLGRFQTSIP